MDMAEGMVLGLLQAFREGDWDLHLHSIRQGDMVSYSRYLTPYFTQMTNLGDKNPEVQKSIQGGRFFRSVSQ